VDRIGIYNRLTCSVHCSPGNGTAGIPTAWRASFLYFLTERSIKNYQDWKLPAEPVPKEKLLDRHCWNFILIGGWRKLPREQRACHQTVDKTNKQVGQTRIRNSVDYLKWKPKTSAECRSGRRLFFFFLD
jgi:hypothetical protein